MTSCAVSFIHVLQRGNTLLAKLVAQGLPGAYLLGAPSGSGGPVGGFTKKN